MDGWQSKKALITVRTYPTPSWRGIEVSCTAAVTAAGSWMRIFPVPYRYLDSAKRFKKYQWIEARFRRASGDSRPESHNIDRDSIRIVSDVIPTTNKWEPRKAILRPLIRPSMEAIKAERDTRGFPTLGLFKPNRIKRLVIEDDAPAWSTEQLAKLRQFRLFEVAPRTELEKIPFKFRYEFSCDAADCNGHAMICTDWEMAQGYRRFLRDYGPQNWQQKFRQKFESEMIERFDTHFYVGNMHAHPENWIIVGLFYPPK